MVGEQTKKKKKHTENKSSHPLPHQLFDKLGVSYRSSSGQFRCHGARGWERRKNQNKEISLAAFSDKGVEIISSGHSLPSISFECRIPFFIHIQWNQHTITQYNLACRLCSGCGIKSKCIPPSRIWRRGQSKKKTNIGCTADIYIWLLCVCLALVNNGRLFAVNEGYHGVNAATTATASADGGKNICASLVFECYQLKLSATTTQRSVCLFCVYICICILRNGYYIIQYICVRFMSSPLLTRNFYLRPCRRIY